jgi:hypothetical protein
MMLIVLIIAMLVMSGHGTSALNSTSWARCRVYPDPHFSTVCIATYKRITKTFIPYNWKFTFSLLVSIIRCRIVQWHGDYYDYHGGCDLVLITNSLLDFHVRTQNFTGWSGVVAAAIKIGGAKLEVQEPTGTIFVNNINVTSSPPGTVGGYPFAVLVGPPTKFRLNLTGGQYIELTRTYGNTLQVDVLGHGSDFVDSEGLCANWTASSPNALIGRNGFTVYPLASPIPYGEEWQVNTTAGDPLLFQTNASAQCRYTQGQCKDQGTGNTICIDRANKAKIACANVTDARNTRANCEFDVVQTGDVGFATAVAYKDPLITDPPELCQEVVTTTVTGNATCSKRGGRCVYRCDNTMYDCLDSLCTGPYGGCSCAFKYNSTTRAPTMKPIAAPVTQSVPTKAPNRRRRPCGLFRLSIICFNGCGLIGRFLGLC